MSKSHKMNLKFSDLKWELAYDLNSLFSIQASPLLIPLVFYRRLCRRIWGWDNLEWLGRVCMCNDEPALPHHPDTSLPPALAKLVLYLPQRMSSAYISANTPSVWTLNWQRIYLDRYGCWRCKNSKRAS